MGDTINEFILFVTNNPLMLGLCIAIVVLFIVLIIVLFSGKKTTKEIVEQPADTSSEVTIDPIQTPVTPEVSAPVDNAFSVENIQNTFDDINKENKEAEGPQLFTEEEAPINIDEVMNLKEKVDASNGDIPAAPIPAPVELKSSTPEKVEIPVPEAPVIPEVPVSTPNSTDTSDLNNDFDNLIKEINMMKTEAIPVQQLEENRDTSFQNILPPDDLDKTIIPQSDGDINLNKLFEDDDFLNPNKGIKIEDINAPVPPAPAAPAAPVEPAPVAPAAPVDPAPVNIPETDETNIFDEPVNEVKTVTPDGEEVNLDDIELPKFREDSSDALDNLKGESFNL